MFLFPSSHIPAGCINFWTFPCTYKHLLKKKYLCVYMCVCIRAHVWGHYLPMMHLLACFLKCCICYPPLHRGHRDIAHSPQRASFVLAHPQGDMLLFPILFSCSEQPPPPPSWLITWVVSKLQSRLSERIFPGEKWPPPLAQSMFPQGYCQLLVGLFFPMRLIHLSISSGYRVRRTEGNL